MFLHIGNNIILQKKDIIAIYNISSINKTKEYNKLIDQLKENNNYINFVKEDEKSLIITKEESKVKGYISNISSITLGKRAQANIKNRF